MRIVVAGAAIVDTLHGQIVVSLAAVQRGASGTFVFVVNPDHAVSIRMVTLGQTENDRVAVGKGLMTGETVVVDGADRLKDGARVVLPGEQAPAMASGQTRPAASRGGRSGARGGRGGEAAIAGAPLDGLGLANNGHERVSRIVPPVSGEPGIYV